MFLSLLWNIFEIILEPKLFLLTFVYILSKSLKKEATVWSAVHTGTQINKFIKYYYHCVIINIQCATSLFGSKCIRYYIKSTSRYLSLNQNYLIFDKVFFRERSKIISLKFCLLWTSRPPVSLNYHFRVNPSPPKVITLYHSRCVVFRHILCVLLHF